MAAYKTETVEWYDRADVLLLTWKGPDVFSVWPADCNSEKLSDLWDAIGQAVKHNTIVKELSLESEPSQLDD